MFDSVSHFSTFDETRLRIAAILPERRDSNTQSGKCGQGDDQ
jgi:hypothetical protein